MSESNGKTKFIWFLIGILQTIVFGWVWRVSANQDTQALKVNTLEANYKNIDDKLTDIKEQVGKLWARRAKGNPNE